jgi:AcrR family transcriptional regulator
MPGAEVSRRELRRSSLLVAVQQALLEPGQAALSVPRIVALAGVSQGTFYNYFESLDAALDGVGEVLVNEHARLVDQATQHIDDDAVVFSHSTRTTLLLAADQGGYGRLLFDSRLPVDRFVGGLRARMATDVESGVRSGLFAVDDDDLDLVLSMVSGSILGIALDLHRGRLAPAAVEKTAERLLRYLGVTTWEAARVAHLPLELPMPRPLPLASVSTGSTAEGQLVP